MVGVAVAGTRPRPLLAALGVVPAPGRPAVTAAQDGADGTFLAVTSHVRPHEVGVVQGRLGSRETVTAFPALAFVAVAQRLLV